MKKWRREERMGRMAGLNNKTRLEMAVDKAGLENAKLGFTL